VCARAFRGTKAMQMPDGRLISFNAKDRAALPAALLIEIRALNALDDKLWKHAELLMDGARAALSSSGALQKLPPQVKHGQGAISTVKGRSVDTLLAVVDHGMDTQRTQAGARAAADVRARLKQDSSDGV